MKLLFWKAMTGEALAVQECRERKRVRFDGEQTFKAFLN